MRLFFLTFFAVYGSVHAYAFLRARSAFGFGPGIGIPLALFMLAMTMAPFLIRVLEQREYEAPARMLSYIAYLWMAVLFLYLCSSLVMDGANLVLRGAAWASGRNASSFVIPARPSFLAAAAVSLVICVYGYFSALDIRTERMVIETAKLPAGTDRFKIVQISDVHLGLIVRCDRLARIMEIVKAEKPDLFVSTGDLVDAQINHMTGLAELLQQVRAPHGNFAITGNHEYYAGLSQALDFTRSAGFKLLRGEAVAGGIINIAGVNDPTGLQLKTDREVPEAEMLSRLPRNKFTLLLKHRPAIDGKAAMLFDLQLSGHTHKGQIFPFTYLAKMAYPLNAGAFELPQGGFLRVSRGTGTWGPPVRFLSPPEVTVIELVRKTGESK